MAAGSLADGFFYTGLTRDDMAGLRLLYSSTNVNTETAAPNSTALTGGGLTITNLSDEYELTTSNLTALILASRTNNPAALQALYPGLVISSVISNFNGTFTYTFGNVVYYTLYTNTSVKYQVQTTRIATAHWRARGQPGGHQHIHQIHHHCDESLFGGFFPHSHQFVRIGSSVFGDQHPVGHHQFFGDLHHHQLNHHHHHFHERGRRFNKPYLVGGALRIYRRFRRHQFNHREVCRH